MLGSFCYQLVNPFEQIPSKLVFVTTFFCNVDNMSACTCNCWAPEKTKTSFMG